MIRAGTLTEGLSNLVTHALREDGSAACSSYLFVSLTGTPAHKVDRRYRCKTRACQKLYAQADAEQSHQEPRS